jgi:hypothetical protein
MKINDGGAVGRSFFGGAVKEDFVRKIPGNALLPFLVYNPIQLSNPQAACFARFSPMDFDEVLLG